jgi:hypothetical protein
MARARVYRRGRAGLSSWSGRILRIVDLLVLLLLVVACCSGFRLGPVTDVESACACYGGAPLSAGATWTTRMRSAVTPKLEMRLVEAAGGRMRFVSLPM